jgi:gluconate 2-dehydrogenase gamma chain
MKGDHPSKGPGPSRRDLLRGAGMAGAAAAAGGGAALAQPTPQTTTAPRREALETLTAGEADILEAVCARLIPSDASGPGAAEARAAHYIDRALGGALASSREAYRSGLAALDAQARAAHGGPFARLAPEAQDAVLIDVEAGKAPGFSPDGAAFFTLVRGHTLQGTFGDPYYGGNAGFVGWDMIGYPGVRLAATAEQQRMDPHLKPNHASAYDYAMFNRAGGALAMETHIGQGPLPDGMMDMSHEH